MADKLDDAALAQLFSSARTHNQWRDQPVSKDLLEQVWDLAKWGPTSMNCCPTRVVFVTSAEAKEKLKPCLSEGNIAKTMSAPVCAIIATDSKFYERMDALFPVFPGAADMFAETPDLAEVTAFRNGTLQAAYLIMACRALGLDCGPMSGFDNDKVDAAFFDKTSLKSNFLINIGYGDPAGLHPRGPRPDFDMDCKVV